MNMLHRVFAYETDALPGEHLRFRLFEAFIGIATASLSWTWALYARHLRDVPRPLGIAQHVDLSVLLTPGVPLVLAALVTGLCVLGYRRRAPALAYALALLLLHGLYVLRFSLGKATHGSTVVGLGLLGLALGLGFFDDPRTQRRFTLGFVCLFLGLAYVLAACSKLVGTGLTWPDGRHLWLWMGERTVDAASTHGTAAPTLLQQYLNAHYLAATALLTGGLVTESLGWLLWWRRPRPFITLALVGLHVGIALVLGIRFTLFVAVLLLVGLPWPALWTKTKQVAG